MNETFTYFLTFLYSLGGFITFIGYYPTIKDLLKKKASANIHTYLIWTITVGIASLYGFFVLKDLAFIVVTNLNLLACAVILILGLRLKYSLFSKLYNRNFKDAKAYFWKEKYSIVKSKRTIPDAFVNIIDKDEITIIIEQNRINNKDVLEKENDWRILTLDVVFPMNVTGVTAKIASLLAENNISIMPIAAFSRDHFLIKDKDVLKATKALESLGLQITL